MSLDCQVVALVTAPPDCGSITARRIRRSPAPGKRCVSLARRISQFGQFFGRGRLPSLTLHPFPWRESGTPRYQVSNELDDPDGHGGYARGYRFDERGLPFTDGENGPLYDPLVVARYGIRMLAISGVRSSPVAAEQAHLVLEPLVVSAAPTGAWGRAGHPDAMSSDHPSALVQGVGLSALVRLSGPEPSLRVRNAIERAFERLAAPVEQGGTVATLGGLPFLEEYPSRPPSHVLNGALYALFGLYDLEDALGHARAAALARDVERAIERALPRFDVALGWSRYALCLRGRAMLSSAQYHHLHVAGLRLLAERTGRSAFTERADRWERALQSRWRRTPMAVAKAFEIVLERRVLDTRTGELLRGGR